MATSITYRNCDDQTVDKAWANPKATLLWSSRMRKRGKSGVRQSMYSKCATPTKMQELYAKMKKESAEAFKTATAKEDFKWDLKRGLVSISLGGEAGACENTEPVPKKQPRRSPSSEKSRNESKLVVSTSPATPERKKGQAGPVFSIFMSATKAPEPSKNTDGGGGGGGGGLDDPIEDSSQSDDQQDNDATQEEQHLALSPSSSASRRRSGALAAAAHTPAGAGTSLALTRENLERNAAREEQQRRREELNQNGGGSWNPVPVFGRTGRSPQAAGGGGTGAARSLDLPTLPTAAMEQEEQDASPSCEHADDLVQDGDDNDKDAAKGVTAIATITATTTTQRTKPPMSPTEAKRQWAMVFQSPVKRPSSQHRAAAATADEDEDDAAKKGKKETEDEDEEDESGSFPEMNYQSSWMVKSDPSNPRGPPNLRGPALKPTKQRRNFSFREMLYKADQLLIQHDAPFDGDDDRKRARRVY